METTDHSINDVSGRQVERREFLRRALLLGVSVPAASGLLAACSSSSAPASAPKQEAPAAAPRQEAPAAAPKQAAPAAAAPAAAAKGAEEDLTPLIEAAKREGAVVAAGNSIQFDETKKALAEAFRTKYGLPGNFQVDILEKNIGELTKQLQEELMAGKLSTDVTFFNTVAWFADMAKQNKLMAYDAPEYKNYTKWDNRPAFNNRPYYVSDLTILMSIAWNKDIIKGNNFTSWFDLLKPEYRGKISVISARLATSSAASYKAMKETPEIGKKFFEELGKLDAVTLPKTDVNVEKIVSGEYPISAFPSTRPYGFWKLQGAKNVSQSFPKEGVFPAAIPTAILSDAPHPNAAKLWVNFYRTKDAQQITADFEGRQSGRTDVTSPNSEFVPNINDLKLIVMDEVAITKDEFGQLGKEWEAMFGA